MSSSAAQPRQGNQRDLMFLSNPKLWSTWPYLPVIRRRPGDEYDCGILYDAFHVSNRTG